MTLWDSSGDQPSISFFECVFYCNCNCLDNGCAVMLINKGVCACTSSVTLPVHNNVIKNVSRLINTFTSKRPVSGEFSITVQGLLSDEMLAHI